MIAEMQQLGHDGLQAKCENTADKKVEQRQVLQESKEGKEANCD